MFVSLIEETVRSSFPILIMVLVTAILFRCLYYKNNRHKVYLHKELMHLIFITYILLLFMLLSKSDMNSLNGFNLVPFKEIMRYEFMSNSFIYNVLGNIIIFMPFGYFVGYYIHSRKGATNFIAALGISVTVEFIQYFIGRTFDIDDIILNVVGAFIGFTIYKILYSVKRSLPNFMQKDGLYNVICIILVIVIVLYFMRVMEVISFL